MTGGYQVPIAVRAYGVDLAKRMFRDIGLTLDFRRGLPLEGIGEKETQAVLIEIQSTSRAQVSGAMGRAAPYEGSRIVVQYDAMMWAEKSPRLAGILLGHVLAHEIAHVLQGVARHSADGVMKARWSKEDLEIMQLRPLQFEAFDIDLIQSGVVSRWERGRGAGGATALSTEHKSKL
jgi:hypothetical protein